MIDGWPREDLRSDLAQSPEEVQVMNGNVEVSVIMPAYNEEQVIEECFHRVVRTLKRYGKTFEIILEEDGSTDRTPQIIDELADKYHFVKALHFPRRMGKGFGVRMGLSVCRGDLIVLLDSDMEYPPEKIPALLDEMNGVDIVVGGRTDWRNRKTKVWRLLSSIIYVLLLKFLFGTDGLRDPQSGFKAYKREVMEAVSPLTSNGFEIDTEILLKALKRGYGVKHLPVTYIYKGNSKVDMLRDPLRMLLSVLSWRINGTFKARKRRRKRIRYSSLLTDTFSKLNTVMQGQAPRRIRRFRRLGTIQPKDRSKEDPDE